jgi:hypothetical protein
MSKILVNSVEPTQSGGNVDLIGFRFLEKLLGDSTFRKDWTPLTHYNLKDVVIATSGIYRCITDHTSGASFVATNWEPLYLETLQTVVSDYTAMALALS